MDAQSITNLVAAVGLIIQAVVAIVVVVAFLWRIPSKDDVRRVDDNVRRVENKADSANRQNQDIRGDIKVLTEKVERIEGYFEPPRLKASGRERGPHE